MYLKKTLISTTIAASLSTPTLVLADIIDFNFTGVFTFIDSAGMVITNSDTASPTTVDGQGNNYPLGGRTPFSGSATTDTTTGFASVNIDAFSFLGNGFASASEVSFQAIGDGMGNPGTLLAATMNYSWNGNFNFPVTAILDASGFFSTIGAVGTSWTVQTGCASCATSATPDTFPTSPFSTTVGAVPIAMTTFNTAGITQGAILPLTDDGIAGSTLTTTPFTDANFAFDFTTINATNVPQVPIPAAAWLFGSGLLGLVSIARRQRSN